MGRNCGCRRYEGSENKEVPWIRVHHILQSTHGRWRPEQQAASHWWTVSFWPHISLLQSSYMKVFLLLSYRFILQKLYDTAWWMSHVYYTCGIFGGVNKLIINFRNVIQYLLCIQNTTLWKVAIYGHVLNSYFLSVLSKPSVQLPGKTLKTLRLVQQWRNCSLVASRMTMMRTSWGNISQTMAKYKVLALSQTRPLARKEDSDSLNLMTTTLLTKFVVSILCFMINLIHSFAPEWKFCVRGWLLLTVDIKLLT